MKTYRNGKYIALCFLGVAMLVGGPLMAKLIPDGTGILLTLPPILFGVGAGVLGGSLGKAIRLRMDEKHPAAAKQVKIEKNDERNVRISDRAKGRAYNLMIYVYAGILIVFALMQVDFRVILTMVAAYLFVIFSNVYYLVKYHKSM